MEIIVIRNQAQETTIKKHSFFEYCEFALFLPAIFLGIFYAKASLYFRTGKTIGENF